MEAKSPGTIDGIVSSIEITINLGNYENAKFRTEWTCSIGSNEDPEQAQAALFARMKSSLYEQLYDLDNPTINKFVAKLDVNATHDDDHAF